ncbi:MAG: MarR family winged helix-turn-helix transcriptional regulator [Burkholderiales bacterium]
MPKPAAAKLLSSPDEHLGYWLRFISIHTSHVFSLKLESLGVTVAEWMVLRTLYGSNLTSPSALADAMGRSRGAISRLVERLVNKKLIKRVALREDRRGQSITLTRSGVNIVPKLNRLAEGNEERFFSHFKPKERQQLIHRLKQIAKSHNLKEVPLE